MKPYLVWALAVLSFACGGVATAVYIRHPGINYDELARQAGAVQSLPSGLMAVAELKPKGDRFQIFQSPIMARLTFKLDSYTGDVWQVVVDKRGVLSWEPVPVVSPQRVTPSGAPRFQIVLSNLIAKNSFLLDFQTGLTWILTVGKDSSVQWEPMETLSR